MTFNCFTKIVCLKKCLYRSTILSLSFNKPLFRFYHTVAILMQMAGKMYPKSKVKSYKKPIISFIWKEATFLSSTATLKSQLCPFSKSMTEVAVLLTVLSKI